MGNINVIGGRLYQWDTNRTVEITPFRNHKVDEVHFENPNSETALVVEPVVENKKTIAAIPNILLQSGSKIHVFVVMYADGGERTIFDCSFGVTARQKPDDYVYTETEVKDYADLEIRIKALEQDSGGGTVKTVNGVPPDEAGNVEIEIPEAEWTATKNLVGGNIVYIPEQKLSNGMWSKLQKSLQAGSLYDVTFNGEVYICEAISSESGLVLGNNTSLSLNDYPFCIYWAGGTATSGMFFKRSDISYPVTLKVTDHPHYEYNQLPVEYLPKASPVTDSVGDTVTGEEFNALLTALRNAGYLST